MKLQLRFPLSYVSINQRFGQKDPKYTAIGLAGHNGIDFYAIDGTPVYAAHDGEVVVTGTDGAGGLAVVIRTNNVFDYGDKLIYFKTIYMHLKTGSIKVKPNQQVLAGDLLALADNTGYSTGSHLHFGLKPVLPGEQDWQWYNSEPGNGYLGAIDPMPYLPPFNSYNKLLSFGDVGTEVAKVQAYLIRNKYLGPQQTLGKYDKEMQDAVLAFQIKNCSLSWYERYIIKGSKIGPKTLLALNNTSLGI